MSVEIKGDPRQTADEVIRILGTGNLVAASLMVWGRRLERSDIDPVLEEIRKVEGWGKIILEHQGKIHRTDTVGRLDTWSYE